MRKVVNHAQVALVLSLLGLLVALAARPAVGAVVKGTLYSPSNGRDVGFRVFTPPGYTAKNATRYPVVFSLHGSNGTPSQRATTYVPTLTAKMNAGEIMPMIWVFPDGQTNSWYGDAFDGHKQVYSNIINELVPHIDATFKTIGNRDNRAVEGFSMGGFGAGLYAAKETELFSASLLMGAVLPTWADMLRKKLADTQEMYNSVEANWLPYSVYDETRINAAAIDATVNYKMIIGDADGNMRGNVRFRDHLTSLGIDPQFQIIPGVKHSGGLYLKEGSGLRFLNDHFLRAQGGPPTVAAVPEPCSLSLAGAAGVVCNLVARGRRRLA